MKTKKLAGYRGLPRPRTVLSALAAVMLLAGCGGKSSDAGSSDADAAGSKLPGSPIVVAGMVNVSGPFNATDKVAADVLKAWAEHTNRTGGIGGHPVKVRIADTRGDAATASTVAKNLLADKSVVAVMLASNSIEGAIAPLFAAGDVAVSGTGYNPKVWSALPNFYTVTTTFPAVINEQLKSAVDVKAKSFASVSCSESPNCLSSVPIIKATAGALGIKYAGNLQVAATQPNYTAECLKIIKQGADFTQLNTNTDVTVRLVADCQQQGYKGWFGASAGSITQPLYASSPTLRLAGGVNAFPWWLDTPAVKTFRAAMADAGVKEKTYGGTTATGMWTAAELFRKALSKVGEKDHVTRKTVQDAYGSVKGVTLDGLLSKPITYTAGKPAPMVPCYWLYTYENGKFGGGAKPTCDGTAS